LRSEIHGCETNIKYRGRKLHLFASSHGQNPAEATFRGNEEYQSRFYFESLCVLYTEVEDTAVIERPSFVGSTERKWEIAGCWKSATRIEKEN